MPVAVGGDETGSRRSSEEHHPMDSNYSSLNATLYNSPNLYDFPKLEGKDPHEQTEILLQELGVFTRIRDGAENLLELHPNDLGEALRKNLESELFAARKNIEAISKKLDEVRAPPRVTKKKPVIVTENNTHYTYGKRKANIAAKKSREDLADKDDFRTAMTLATAQIARLVVHSRSAHFVSPRSPRLAPVSPISAPSPPIFDPEVDKSRIEAMETLLSALKRNHRVRYEVDTKELMRALIPALADHASKESRTCAYRLLRYVIISPEGTHRFHELGLDWFLVRSLARDNKHHLEKEQAIMLIRAMANVSNSISERHSGAGCGSIPISEAVIRAVIAIADQPEDPFKGICLVTLAEILLIDIELMYRTDGIRSLIQAISDGPAEMAPLIVSAFLSIIDAPRTRVYLRADVDLENVLSGVTDAYGKGEDHVEKIKLCSKIIQVMLRSFSGLMYLCMNNMQGIRSTVDSMRIPSLQNREMILDIFFELLNIKTPEWYQTFIDGRRLTLYGRGKLSPSKTSTHQDSSSKVSSRFTLIDQYFSLLLLALVKAGLLDALTGMLQESDIDPALARKATLLIGEVLQLANRVLPLSVASKIQMLPRIFDLAADYKSGPNRIVGTTALASLDSFNRNKTRLQPLTYKDGRPRANSVEESMRRNQRQIDQNKMALGMQMDDKVFQNLLLETQVMLTRDQTQWNYDILMDLLEGPFLNPKRLEEAFRVAKWGRKLMTFFHPYSLRFSNLSKTRANHKWVRFANGLLTTLLKHTEGRRFLAEDPLLSQVLDCFTELDPINGKAPTNPVLSRRRIETTLSYAYLEMIGVLSRSPEGIELLERFHLFTALYQVTELPGREDIIKEIIPALDYSTDSHARLILSKALTCPFIEVRMYATEYLGHLLQTSFKASTWALPLLLTQLYDPSPEVCELAVRTLEEACESPEILNLTVELQPTLDHLGEIGDPLLLKFMSTPVGFEYLLQSHYIEREMDAWFHERNYHYVIRIEQYLSRAFNSNGLEEEEDIGVFDGTVPAHFYGAMAKTPMGCEILNEKGHFAEFSHFIRQHGHEKEDFDLILKLKSVLWAVGNIGATESGLPFMEEEELIPTIADIARNSEVLSIRGTCFFVLGLISSTVLGAELLDDYGWEATTTPLGMPTGLAIPVNIDDFVSIPAWEPPPIKDGPEVLLPPPSSSIERDALTAIYNLGNNVIANAASRILVRLKARPETKAIFNSIPLFYRALQTINRQHYRLPVRRYIFDLFDVRFNAETINALNAYGKSMRVQPMNMRRDKTERPLTMIRTVQKADEYEVVLDIDEGHEQTKHTEEEEPPSLRLEPLQKYVGFDA